jgi:hypothetical protein
MVTLELWFQRRPDRGSSLVLVFHRFLGNRRDPRLALALGSGTSLSKQINNEILTTGGSEGQIYNYGAVKNK